jgi:propanol-preferring alcohol dehydrogenase
MMRAMQLSKTGPLHDRSLERVEVPVPIPAPGEVRLRVLVCGVCHTELDEIESRTPPPHLPVIPGHQVIGRIDAIGDGVEGLSIGDRVGVAWIFHACGHCRHCIKGEENLCADFQATGRDVNGGYAEKMVVSAQFIHAIPRGFSDAEAAPLLCAGAVGFRALRLTGLIDGEQAEPALGFSGFGASAHLVLQLARLRLPSCRFYVFARSAEERAFALDLGADWVGSFDDTPPYPLDAIIDTTPAWRPVVSVLRHLAPGGRLVINAIRKEDADKAALLDLDYARDLWMEKQVRSVANVTREDVRECLLWAAEADIHPQVEVYDLEDANQALLDLKQKPVRGAKVLRVAADATVPSAI